MKLATFSHSGKTGIGAVIGDELVDLGSADPSLPVEMIAFLAAGKPALAVRAAGQAGASLSEVAPTRDEWRLRREDRLDRLPEDLSDAEGQR